MKYIFEISENVLPPKKSIYVMATEKDIRQRMYLGGFMRFLSSVYDYASHYHCGENVNGSKILSLQEFDKWRNEHFCN